MVRDPYATVTRRLHDRWTNSTRPLHDHYQQRLQDRYTTVDTRPDFPAVEQTAHNPYTTVTLPLQRRHMAVE